MPPCEQEFGEVAADAAHSAGCSGHEDRVVVFMFRRHSRRRASEASDSASYRLKPAFRKGANVFFGS